MKMGSRTDDPKSERTQHDMGSRMTSCATTLGRPDTEDVDERHVVGSALEGP